MLLADNQWDKLDEEAEPDEDEEEEEEPFSDRKKCNILKAFAIHSLACKTPVALLNGMMRRGNRLLAYSLGRENICAQLNGALNDHFKAYLDQPANDVEAEFSPGSLVDFEPFPAGINDPNSGGVSVRGTIMCMFLKHTYTATLVDELIE